MKKIYEKPETILVKVATSPLMAASPGIIDENADTTNQQEGGGYMLGRGSSIWDDEE
jgi:hypothetical protein